MKHIQSKSGEEKIKLLLRSCHQYAFQKPQILQGTDDSHPKVICYEVLEIISLIKYI